jgi:hypothetical protein
MHDLVVWESFYVIVGAAAGALIGLQFVVMTLIAERPTRGAKIASAAFATPTIVHFSMVLFLSSVVSAPWTSIAAPAVVLVLTGVAGIGYASLIGWRVKNQAAYTPDLEDQMFHVVLPFVAYVFLTLSALAALAHVRGGLFGVGAASLLLLFVGIHNAWDATNYQVFVNLRRPDPAKVETTAADKQ